MSGSRVTGLALTPVKGTRLRAVDAVTLDGNGVRQNRRFFLIDAGDEMVNSLRLGALHSVVAEYSESRRRLRLVFPDGRVLDDEVRLGPVVTTSFYGQPMPASLVEGAWSDALSELVGKPLRLVEAGDEGAVDRGPRGAVSLISRTFVSGHSRRERGAWLGRQAFGVRRPDACAPTLRVGMRGRSGIGWSYHRPPYPGASHEHQCSGIAGHLARPLQRHRAAVGQGHRVLPP